MTHMMPAITSMLTSSCLYAGQTLLDSDQDIWYSCHFWKALQFAEFGRWLVESQRTDAGRTLRDSDQDIYDIVVMRHAPIEPLPYVQCVVVILKPTIHPITVMRGVLQLYYIVSVTPLLEKVWNCQILTTVINKGLHSHLQQCLWVKL